VTGSGTSGLSSTILPELAQEISLRYVKQMTQHPHRVRAACGRHRPDEELLPVAVESPGAQITVSTNGAMP
jgi:hypothetical protein